MVFALVLLAACGAAHADKLIKIPTAGLAKLNAEFATEIGEDLDIFTAQVGFKGFELLGRRYHDLPGGDNETEFGGQLQILPEGLAGFATPGLSIGVWDVADESPFGRRFFGVVSTVIPYIDWLSFLGEVKVHGGLGSGDLAGFFIGAQASLGPGFTLTAEFDSDNGNFGLWWSPIKPLRLKLEQWGGDTFVGAQFVSPL
jgi:hypothetical protein